MPGSLKSWVKVPLPSVLSALSLRERRSLPIRVKSLGALSTSSAGTFWRDAASANSPNPALRPEPAWLTTPLLTVISPAGTFHCSAAAATSIARAPAPALRICSKELAMAELPPVPWIGPKARLLYSAALAGAPSTRTWLQSASSSSASRVARPV
ncbi:hypothetical protein D3C80_1677460 [compost metagenome]